MDLDLSRFARIIVDRGEKKGRGTGYFLTKDLVLTAKHVVRDASLIVVQFQDFSREHFEVVAETAWVSEASDAALLRVETDLRIARQVLLTAPLSTDEDYRSRGWARASTAEDEGALTNSLTALSGKAYQFAEDAATFEIGVDDPPKDVSAWKGVSGAPILCGWRLVGLIAKGESIFSGNRLRAVSISLLWQDDEFRRVLGEQDDESERRRSIVDDLAKILTKNSRAARAIADEQDRWAAVLKAGGPRVLAQELCAHPSWRDAVEAIDRAHESMCGERDDEHRAVHEILSRVLPEIYRNTELQALPDTSGGQWITLPYEGKTLAELAVAGFEGRALSYSPLESHNAVPRGEGLAQPFFIDASEDPKEEHGFDFGKRNAFQAWILDFAEWLKLSAEDLAMLAQPHRFDEHLPLVNRAIKRDMKRGRPRRYFLFHTSFREHHQPFLNLLREHLDELHLVEMTTRTRVQERLDTEPLADILFRWQEFNT